MLRSIFCRCLVQPSCFHNIYFSTPKCPNVQARAGYHHRLSDDNHSFSWGAEENTETKIDDDPSGTNSVVTNEHQADLICNCNTNPITSRKRLILSPMHAVGKNSGFLGEVYTQLEKLTRRRFYSDNHRTAELSSTSTTQKRNPARQNNPLHAF